ncbi:MAG: hypothetical protein HFI94_02740 [Lachnospiraceae bacterium]|jgi:hypothetical protein|nr:hypothetical protein [Lachnospiraceae bacterium]
MRRIDLIKQNSKQFLLEIKRRRELKREYSLDKLKRNLPVDNSSGYEDFAPASKIENGEEYIKALHWALKNKDVKNIALAGPYGSGKSSIIHSYLKKYPSTRALNISLATFDWEKKEYDEFKDEVELGILKQLFYKVDSSKIPQSRYRKIHKQYYRRFMWMVTIIVVLFLSAFAFFFPEAFKDCMDRIIRCGNYYHLSKWNSYILAGVFGVIGILVASYIWKWVLTHLKVKEVNIADRATLSDVKEEDSIFDRNMDEMIYFFEETNYDTIFIEDLDRFDSSEIFVKLRELNTILNNYDLIKRRIIFIYAIRDDMFKDEERTKFFDFIIPVIPIINSTNSGEILIDKLKITMQEDGTYRSSLYDISSSYITLVSPFIEDMRVLTSICNEFVIYKKTLQSLRLKDEEMFSIMIFKNLFPSDFAELEAERGIVKKAFDNKKEFVNKMIQRLRDCNEKYLAALEGIGQDILIDLNEMKAAFMCFLTKNKGPFNYCRLNDESYSYNQIMAPDFNMGVFNVDSSITIYYYNENGYGRSFSVNNLKMEIENNGKSYIHRFNYLQNSEEDRKEAIRRKIEDNENSIMDLYTFSLKMLLEKYGTEEVLSDEVRKNKVLVFFLKKGFINENYADYINYFYPNSITSNEMNFIRGIRMEKAAGDFSYRIKNVVQVCDRIDDYEFRQVEALNFDVVDYLITKRSSDTKCIKLFEGLVQGSTTAIEFIKSYVERNQNVPVFIKILCNQYPAFWHDICHDESFSENSKFRYLSLIFSYASVEDVIRMNADENEDCISKFILERKHVLTKLHDVNPENMICIIDRLDLQFTCIDIKGVNHAVLDYIFREEQYELNTDMVTSLFEYKYPQKVEGLRRANYTTIYEVSDTSLINYIYLNFEEYVAKFVVEQDTNICEDIHAVEDILERLFKTAPEICKAVLDKEDVIWNDLNDCCKCVDSEEDKKARQIIWDCVLENKMVSASWHNFMCYYECHQLTSVLVNWFDKEIDQLLRDFQCEYITDEIVKSIIVESISSDTFEKFIKKFEVEEFTNSLHDFTVEKVEIMVKERYIPFHIKILKEMEEIEPGSAIEYIIYNKEEFFDKIKEISLSLHIIAQLLICDKFDDSEKIELFTLFHAENVDRELALCIRGLSFKVPKIYVESAWEVLEEEERYQLLLNQLEVYSLDEISDKLSLLAPVYQNLSDRTKRHKEYLDDDNLGYNKQLLKKLKDIGYLTSVENEIYNVGDEKGEKKRFAVWVKKN